MFNNKGGVGKTTLLSNVAGYLALELGKRVLVVDADPQCNATQSLFGDKVITDLYTYTSSFTIYSVIKPLSVGRGYSKNLEPMWSATFGLDVLPGDPRLALTEDLLATDWSQAISGYTRGLRTTFLFSQLLTRCEDYDYVIFDMGPSLGSINRSVLIAADYFVTPMSLDIFSLRAIENISLSLVTWRRQLETGLSLNDEPDELELDNLDWKLRYLGFVTQQYTAKMDAEGNRRPVKAFDRIMRRVPDVVQREIVEKLQPAEIGLDYDLGSIPTLHSLIPLSQVSRKPIFRLGAGDGVVGAHFAKVKEYRAIISAIADRMLRNLAALEQ